jgi:preprotein translocase subunit SecG
MYTLLTILIFIVSALLIIAVLIQNSKGGGLASGFSGGSQIMGVRKTTETIEKATWYLAIGLMVLCIATNFSRPTAKSATGIESSAAERKAKETGGAPAPQQQPQAPAGGNQQQQAPAPAGK